MHKKKVLWTRLNISLFAVLAVVSLLANGLPWWDSRYDNADMDGRILAMWLIVPLLLASVGSALFAGSFLQRFRLGFTCAVCGNPAAVAVRVVKDLLADPTSHNLWPFELAFASVPAIVGASVGAIGGASIVWAHSRVL